MSKNEQLLVVDDDPKNLRIISAALEADEYSIITASHGKQALEVLNNTESPIHAILMDWMMPGMDGLTCLKKIKQNPKFRMIPVIMQTAKVSKQDIIEGIENGAHYYLTKPFDLDVLRSIVKSAVISHKVSRQLTKESKIINILYDYFTHAEFSFQRIEEGQSIISGLSYIMEEVPEQFYGVQELMINAVEHGNLNIHYKEKTQFILDRTYEEELERRLQLPENKNKRVTLGLTKKANHLEFRIKDQGEGFDYQTYLEFDPERFLDLHGRGIAMAKHAHFCNIKYIAPGNEVIVTVPIK